MRKRELILLLATGPLACFQDFDRFDSAPSAPAPVVDTRDGGLMSDAGTAPTAPPAPDGGSADAGGDACPEEGGRQALGHCYFPLETGRTFDASAMACTAAGAHLVTISSAEELAIVDDLAGRQDRWIGLRRPTGSPSNDGSYAWVTGEPRTFTRWGAAEPNGTGECARQQSSGTWADAPCGTSYRAVCERD